MDRVGVKVVHVVRVHHQELQGDAVVVLQGQEEAFMGVDEFLQVEGEVVAWQGQVTLYGNQSQPALDLSLRGIIFQNPCLPDFGGQPFKTLGTFGQMVLNDQEGILHHSSHHAINIIHIGLDQGADIVLNKRHVLLVDNILPEKKIVLRRKPTVFFP